ncbi:hypothetical protein LguiA_010962 [Lonicera macranthoides]
MCRLASTRESTRTSRSFFKTLAQSFGQELLSKRQRFKEEVGPEAVQQLIGGFAWSYINPK